MGLISFYLPMLTLTRDTKRLTIIVVYLLIFFLIITGLYFMYRPTSTCFDKIQNQNEEGIDCGGVCAALCSTNVVGDDVLVREITFLSLGENHYDIVARIFNPNNDIAAARFHYALVLKDGSGNEVARMNDSNFVLPQETKTLLALNVVASGEPVKAVVELSGFEWQRLRGYQSKPELNIYSKRYIGHPDDVMFGLVTGSIVNDSVYDFRVVRIKVVLRDSQGVPLAANETKYTAMTVGREQDVHIPFPKPFSGTVAQVDIEAEADIFSADNFLQRYNTKGRQLEGEGSQPTSL